MSGVRERLELYLPTDVSEQDHLRGVVIGAADRYLPRVVGGTANGKELQISEESQLLLRRATANAVMMSALRDIREETAKTRLLRITSERENGISFPKSRLEKNLSKQRGKRQRDIWGKEGAAKYIFENHELTELTFASVALNRALGSRPTHRKKLILQPDKHSLSIIKKAQDAIVEGIRPTMRRGVEINTESLHYPVCEIADVDVTNAHDIQIRQFLDEVEEAFPLTLSVGRLVVRYDSFGVATG